MEGIIWYNSGCRNLKKKWPAGNSNYNLAIGFPPKITAAADVYIKNALPLRTNIHLIRVCPYHFALDASLLASGALIFTLDKALEHLPQLADLVA